jgi:methylthioribose-1-phosphate isomerase
MRHARMNPVVEQTPNPTATLENSVAFDEDAGVVRILDRRVFPARVEWVTAETPDDVAAAIRDMVTQSSGPLYAATAGMALAAVQARELPLGEARTALGRAGRALATARPTNAHPRDAVARILAAGRDADTVDDLVELTLAEARAVDRDYREASLRLGRATLSLLPERPRILTHCWADAYLFGLVAAAREAGREIEWVATETRPYLQGARLTAHSLRELGQKVTLITDGMAAAALASPDGVGTGAIDAVVTAADRVALDGSVVNKVGTLAHAAAAATFGIPFYAMVEAPDPAAPTGADVVIETRDPAEVLEVLGQRTASPLVTDAWYPAFDVTPPRLVTRIATSRGTFEPARVGEHFSADPATLAERAHEAALRRRRAPAAPPPVTAAAQPDTVSLSPSAFRPASPDDAATTVLPVQRGDE